MEGTHSFPGQEPTVSTFTWQSNKAIFFSTSPVKINKKIKDSLEIVAKSGRLN